MRRPLGLALVATSLTGSIALATVKTVTIDRRLPINQYCPIDNGDFDLTFVAEQPYAKLTIEAFNTTTGGTWIENRVDNIAVITKTGYDAHTVAPPGFGSCYAAPGDPNTPALDFNASGTFERYLTLFDGSAVGWDLNSHALYQAGVSAPRAPASGTDTTGGALALGRLSDGNVAVTTSVLITGLTPGTQFIVTGWWYVQDTSRPLTVKIDTAPCKDDDLDGVSDCAGDCNVHDPGVHPGAVERCDGVDNDCDGQVDEDAPCDRTCDVPQALVGAGRLTSTLVGSTSPTILWTGNRYAVVFSDALSTYDPFIAFASATGTPLGSARPLVITPGNEIAPRAIWTGSEIAVYPPFRRFDREGRPTAAAISVGAPLVWTGKEYGGLTGSTSLGTLAIQRFAPDGTPLTPAISISGGISGVTQYSKGFQLAWNGTHFGMVWEDGGDLDPRVLKFRRFSPNDLASAFPLDLGTTPGTISAPAIAAGGSTFGIVWSDRHINPNGDIYFTRVGSNGAQMGASVRLTTGPAGAVDPAIAWSGSEWGIVWDDLRTGNEEIWFARVDANGVKVGSDVQVTNAAGHSRHPSIVWAGGKYGIAWSDDRDGGNDEIYFTPLGCDCVDGDGDGSSSCVDCTDADSSIYPGAPSPCDGLTNLDCDSAWWPLPEPTEDLDADGFSPCSGDCDDATASVYPGAAEACDGINNDCNSPSWPTTAGIPDADDDFDGFSLCENDCSDTDATVWATPGEVPSITLTNSQFSGTTIRPTAPSSMGGTTGFLYDILRSGAAMDFVRNLVCVASNAGNPGFDQDFDVPPLSGGVFYYLSRARNTCPGALGLGPLGNRSPGVPRTGGTCP